MLHRAAKCPGFVFFETVWNCRTERNLETGSGCIIDMIGS